MTFGMLLMVIRDWPSLFETIFLFFLYLGEERDLCAS